jgi:GNAT superfamily N-acetyltransferase
LKWQSSYKPFHEKSIPEIKDLNVLPPFQKQGIGSELLDTAEEAAKIQANLVGIGVGLYEDYGTAQKLYINRGYRPDGRGVTYNYQPVVPGSSVCIDDDLVLWFTKEL